MQKSGILILLIFVVLFSAYARNKKSDSHSDTLNLKNTSFPYALVAGGSKGIGYAIAEALAKRGYNLVLIARHEAPLLTAKDKLESAYGIHVEILMHDLSLEK